MRKEIKQHLVCSHWGLRTKQRATFAKRMHQNKNAIVPISANIFQRKLFFLTKRQQFPIVCTLWTLEMTSKCSKLKWNHEPLASGFTAKFKSF